MSSLVGIYLDSRFVMLILLPNTLTLCLMMLSLKIEAVCIALR